jgi:hypothetical protein
MRRCVDRRHTGTVQMTLTLIASVTASFTPLPSAAQTLKEVMESAPYRKVASDAEAVTRAKIRKSAREPNVTTNYQLLWRNLKPGSILLDWLGVRNASGKISQASLGMHTEFANGSVNISDREGVRVEITVQVPKPEFVTMAEYKTLSSFNRFRPPALDVVADQVVPFEGIEATYYRHQNGACSLLFNVAKQGIVNLYTRRCSDSSVMMKIAKSLNFERLNSKLNS